MKNNKILFLILLCISIFYGCEKETTIIPEKTQDVSIVLKPSPQGNVLYFKNMNEFSNTVSELHSFSNEELLTWEKNIGIKSFRSRVDEMKNNITTSEGNTEYEKLAATIPDRVFATIVNNNSVYIIGDTIFKVTYDYEYAIPNLKWEKVPDDDLKSTCQDGEIIQKKIERRGFSLNNGDQQKSVLGWPTKRIKLDNGKYALCEAWNMTCINYGSVGIKVVGQRKAWIGYANISMDYGYVIGCGMIGQPFTPMIQYCGSNEETNKSICESVFVWAVGLNPAFTTFYCDFINAGYQWTIDGESGSIDILWE
jgi:hypothetical protein